ncbi:MAG: phosphate/phosphite/phosphonate ABC transporter substrate-binding protein [Deltaproteobacteria bacterium]|nr:phosphate/phosphite/phosphonate ABC transporter substrate-binding protein [Deltaproteobacteria bacterium]
MQLEFIEKFVLVFLLFSVPAVSISKDFLTFASISLEPTREMTQLRPFADYVAKKMAALGVKEARLRIVKNHEAMARLLSENEADIFIDSPLIGSFICYRAGCHPLLRSWKKGKSQYQTLVFARSDSSIYKLADLRGKTLAFELRFSSSGFLAPYYMLLKNGLTLVSSTEKYDDVNAVRYGFSGKDANTVFWVLKNKVDVGSIDNWTFESLSKNVKDSLRVVFSGPPLPRQLAFVREGFGENEPVLKQILLEMHKDPDAQQALIQLSNTAKFDEVSSLEIETLDEIVTSLAEIPSVNIWDKSQEAEKK